MNGRATRSASASSDNAGRVTLPDGATLAGGHHPELAKTQLRPAVTFLEFVVVALRLREGLPRVHGFPEVVHRIAVLGRQLDMNLLRFVEPDADVGNWLTTLADMVHTVTELVTHAQAMAEKYG